MIDEVANLVTGTLVEILIEAPLGAQECSRDLVLLHGESSELTLSRLTLARNPRPAFNFKSVIRPIGSSSPQGLTSTPRSSPNPTPPLAAEPEAMIRQLNFSSQASCEADRDVDPREAAGIFGADGIVDDVGVEVAVVASEQSSVAAGPTPGVRLVVPGPEVDQTGGRIS